MPSRTIKIRELASECKQETDVFKRQRLLFDLVDLSKMDPIGIVDNKPEIIKYKPNENESVTK